MARRGNPISVRLDLNRHSDSSWFSDYYYGKLVHHDVNLRSYFDALRPPTRLTSGFRLGRNIIIHFPKRTSIHVFLPKRRRYEKARRNDKDPILLSYLYHPYLDRDSGKAHPRLPMWGLFGGFITELECLCGFLGSQGGKPKDAAIGAYHNIEGDGRRGSHRYLIGQLCKRFLIGGRGLYRGRGAPIFSYFRERPRKSPGAPFSKLLKAKALKGAYTNEGGASTGPGAARLPHAQPPRFRAQALGKHSTPLAIKLVTNSLMRLIQEFKQAQIGGPIQGPPLRLAPPRGVLSSPDSSRAGWVRPPIGSPPYGSLYKARSLPVEPREGPGPQKVGRPRGRVGNKTMKGAVARIRWQGGEKRGALGAWLFKKQKGDLPNAGLPMPRRPTQIRRKAPSWKKAARHAAPLLRRVGGTRRRILQRGSHIDRLRGGQVALKNIKIGLSGDAHRFHDRLVRSTLPHAALHYFAMQYFFQTSLFMHFDPISVLKHLAPTLYSAPIFHSFLHPREPYREILGGGKNMIARYARCIMMPYFPLTPSLYECGDMEKESNVKIAKPHWDEDEPRDLRVFFQRRLARSKNNKKPKEKKNLIRSCITLFQRSLARAPTLRLVNKRAHFQRGGIRQKIKRKISLFPFVGATFFLMRGPPSYRLQEEVPATFDSIVGDGEMFKKLKKKDQEQLRLKSELALFQLKRAAWDKVKFKAKIELENQCGIARIMRTKLLGKENLHSLIKKLLAPSNRVSFKKGIKILTEILVRNRRIPSVYNKYFHEVKRESENLSRKTKTLTKIKTVKIENHYQSASLIAQDIASQLLQKRGRSFRAIWNKILSNMPKEGIEGIRISCSGRLEGAEIARTEGGKFGKTSRNVFHKKVDYASATVPTRCGILGVKVWISFRLKR